MENSKAEQDNEYFKQKWDNIIANIAESDNSEDQFSGLNKLREIVPELLRSGTNKAEIIPDVTGLASKLNKGEMVGGAYREIIRVVKGA